MFLDHQIVDQTGAPFQGELTGDFLAGAGHRFRQNREADGMLAGGLADQDDVDPPAPQGPEQAHGDSRHSDHAVSLEAQEGHLADRGDSPDRVSVLRSLAADPGSGETRIERVLDQYGDPGAAGRVPL